MQIATKIDTRFVLASSCFFDSPVSYSLPARFPTKDNHSAVVNLLSNGNAIVLDVNRSNGTVVKVHRFAVCDPSVACETIPHLWEETLSSGECIILLIIVQSDKTFDLFDLRSHQHTMHNGFADAHEGLVWNVSRFHDYLVTCSFDGTVKIWHPHFQFDKELSTRNKLHRFDTTHDFKITSKMELVKTISFGTDWIFCSERFHFHAGDVLCLGSNQGFVHRLDANLDALPSLKGHVNSVTHLCNWNQYLVSGDWDRKICIFDKNASLAFQFKTPQRILSMCVWNENLAVADASPSVSVWNGNFEKIVELKPKFFEYRKCKFAASCHNLLYVDQDNQKSLLVLKDKAIPWNVLRLIWIGWLKHTPEECHLAAIPKEILVEIIAVAVL